MSETHSPDHGEVPDGSERPHRAAGDGSVADSPSAARDAGSMEGRTSGGDVADVSAAGEGLADESAREPDVPEGDAAAHRTARAAGHTAEASAEDGPRSEAAARRRRLRAGDAEREDVLQILSNAHVAGRLDTEEVDERQAATLRAKFVDQLPELIDDLPEGERLAHKLEAQAAAASGEAPSPGRASGTAIEASRRASVPATQNGEILPAAPGTGSERSTVAVMGGSEVYVEPTTPVVRGFVLMGGSEIYLTDVLGPGVQVTVETYAMWGGNEIYVPPGVKVVDETVNVMAGNEIAKHARGDGSNGVLVLRGISLMAGNDVKIDPNWKPPTQTQGW